MYKNNGKKNPIKVLFLTGCTGRGGAGNSLYYLLKHIDRNRIDPLVVMPSEGPISKKLRVQGVRAIIAKRLHERTYELRFQQRNRLTSFVSVFLNIYDCLIFTYELTKIIKREKIALVYCNHMMVKLIGTVAAFMKSTPVILHCRTIYHSPIKRFIYLAFGALPNVKKIICVSKAAASNYRYLNHKVSIVHNGVDLEEHNPEHIESILKQKYKIPPSQSVIGFVGRVVKWKGIEVFLKMAEKILSLRKDIFFVVIGDNPVGSTKNTLEDYRATFANNGLSKHILFTGFQDDVRPYLKDLDVLVVPSINPDPCPRSVIEAMAMGIPIVGSASGGILETIQHDYNGYLAKPGDTLDVIEKVLNFIDNKELRERLGHRARRSVKENFNATIVSHKIQEIILESLK